MTITQASATALKGRSFTHALTPTTLIVGPNYSGKTAILEAVRLCLIGYIPEIGKKNSATFELASAAKMSVDLKMDNGSMHRSFWMDKGVTKTDYNSTFDTDLTCPLLDAAAYFAMTETDRTDYVFARVTLPPEFTAAGVIAKLHRLSFGDEHTEELQEAKAETIAACEACFAHLENVADALTQLTTLTLKEKFTAANARAKDTAGTIRTLTELKLREAECSAVTLTDLRNDAARLDGLLSEAQREHGALTERANVAARLLERKRELTALLAVPEPEWMACDPFLVVGPTVEELQAKLADIDKQLKAIPAEDAHATGNAAVARQNVFALETELAGARKRLVDAVAAVEEFDALECCPTCKAKGKGWKSGVLASLNEVRETAGKNVEQLTAHLAAATTAAVKAKMKADAENANADQCCELRTEFMRIKGAIDDRKLKESEAARANERAKAKQQRARDQWAADRAAQRAEMGRMEEVARPTESETVAARAAVLNLEADRIAARGQITAAERLQNDLRRAAEAAREHTLAQSRADVIKLVGKTLKEQKAEMVAAAFGTLLETANGICGGILPSPLAFHEGEIGRWGNGGFITHRTFSGTEKALAYVAIAAALSSAAPFRLLILDELARLTPSLQLRVLDSFAAAVEIGQLDQVIAVLPMDAEDLPLLDGPDGWSIIEMGEAVTA